MACGKIAYRLVHAGNLRLDGTINAFSSGQGGGGGMYVPLLGAARTGLAYTHGSDGAWKSPRTSDRKLRQEETISGSGMSGNIFLRFI